MVVVVVISEEELILSYLWRTIQTQRWTAVEESSERMRGWDEEGGKNERRQKQ